MRDDLLLPDAQKSAHASLQTLPNYDYERVKREFSEDHAKVWDLVRRCHAAEEAEPPMIDVYRLAVKFGDSWFLVLGSNVVEEGWLEFDKHARQRLRQELPNSPPSIEAAVNASVHIQDVCLETRTTPPPDVAGILRLMRDEKIGRPSTYHKHIKRLVEMEEAGYVARNEGGAFTLTALGRIVLDALRKTAFATIGIRHCTELDDDLERIESGEVEPYEIALKHISLVTKVDALTFEAKEDAAIRFGVPATLRERTIPASIDPEIALPANHRLRQMKRVIDRSIRVALQNSSNEEKSRVRAAVAAAAAPLWSLSGNERILEELQFNLAYRWLCGIQPDDILWTQAVFRSLLEGNSEFIQELRTAILSLLRCT